MKKYIPLLAVLVVLISACSIFKGGNKTVTSISIQYDVTKPINYGYRLPIKVIANFSNGKTKDVTSKNDLSITVKGAKYTNGIIYCNSNPIGFQKDTIYLNASYTRNEKKYVQSLILPFNYKGGINLNHNGSKVGNAIDGEKAGTSLFFKHGKKGDVGLDGRAGGVGHDLTVFIWQELSLYYLKVYDMTTDKTYYYKANNNTKSYNFNICGGKGGQGGSGGQGGEGKDGTKTETKTKLPGTGGDGGNGGAGGNGGKGGSIYIFIHPSATGFQNKIYTNNIGGTAGKGGAGGKGGLSGTPLETLSKKNTVNNGRNGVDGIDGLIGASGDVINIEIQQFDIQEAKNN
jgi:hypothetical protein